MSYISVTAAKILVACVRRRARQSRGCLLKLFRRPHNKSQVLPRRGHVQHKGDAVKRTALVISKIFCCAYEAVCCDLIDKSKAEASKRGADAVHQSASASAKIVCYDLWFRQFPARAGSAWFAERLEGALWPFISVSTLLEPRLERCKSAAPKRSIPAIWTFFSPLPLLLVAEFLRAVGHCQILESQYNRT